MKFILTLLLIAILSFAASLYLPWWSIAIVSFIVLVCIPQKPWYAFLCGFVAIFLLWGIISFVISSNNNHLLAEKMSLVIIKIANPILLILTTALVGAIVAGFAALSGSLLKKRTVVVDRNI